MVHIGKLDTWQQKSQFSVKPLVPLEPLLGTTLLGHGPHHLFYVTPAGLNSLLCLRYPGHAYDSIFEIQLLSACGHKYLKASIIMAFLAYMSFWSKIKPTAIVFQSNRVTMTFN